MNKALCDTEDRKKLSSKYSHITEICNLILLVNGFPFCKLELIPLLAYKGVMKINQYLCGKSQIIQRCAPLKNPCEEINHFFLRAGTEQTMVNNIQDDAMNNEWKRKY